MLDVTLYGQKLRFAAAPGLFSYEKPDAASLLLVDVMRNTLPPLRGELLDLGCGYGLLGIALMKTHAEEAKLTMSDTNEIACRYAEKNAALNGVAASVVHSNGFAGIPLMFDHITLNPPIHAGKDVTYRLYEEAAAHLTPRGSLYIVIQKKHGAETALKFLQQIFTDVKILYKRKGFYVVQSSN